MASSVVISAPNAVLGIPRDVWGINSGVTEAADSTCSCTGWTFAHGDGVNKVFELPSLVSSLTSLYRTDWQGTVTLSPIARKNWCVWSNDLSNSWWIKRGTASAVYGATAPDGTATATTLSGVGSTGSNDFYSSPAVMGTAGSPWTPGFWMKRISTSGYLAVTHASGTSYGSFTVNISNLPDSWVWIYPGSPYVTVNYPWFLDSTGAARIQIYASSGPLSFLIANVQYESGNSPTSSIFTSGAPVALTDYAASGSTITLAEAPLLGSDLSVDADLVPHTCLSFNHGGRR